MRTLIEPICVGTRETVGEYQAICLGLSDSITPSYGYSIVGGGKFTKVTEALKQAYCLGLELWLSAGDSQNRPRFLCQGIQFISSNETAFKVIGGNYLGMKITDFILSYSFTKKHLQLLTDNGYAQGIVNVIDFDSNARLAVIKSWRIDFPSGIKIIASEMIDVSLATDEEIDGCFVK